MGSTGFEPVTSSVSTKRSPPELTARARREPGAIGRLLDSTPHYSETAADCKEGSVEGRSQQFGGGHRRGATQRAHRSAAGKVAGRRRTVLPRSGEHLIRLHPLTVAH